MAQFRRSIQTKGFRPEETSNQNINQLQAYSDRITNALREERDAVISNRNRTADALKENAQIEERQAARNFDIQNQNIETKIKEQQNLSLAAQRDFQSKVQASQEIFGSLKDMSLTAALKLQEIEVTRLKEQWNNELAEIIMLGENSPKYRQIEAQLKDAQIEEVKARTDVAAQQEKGLDTLEGDRYNNVINDLSPGIKLGYLYLQGKKYGTFLNEQFMDSTRQYKDGTGKVFTGVEAGRNQERAGIVAAESAKLFLDINRLTGINPSFLQKSGLLPTILNANQSITNTAGKAQHEDYKTDFKAQLSAGISANAGDPASTANFAQQMWPELLRLFGRAGALDELQAIATTVDSEGNPASNVAGILATKVGPNGEAFGDYWPKRREEIETKLAQAKNAAHSLDQATKQREAEQEFDAVRGEIQGLLAEAGAQEDSNILESASARFFDKYGFVPRGFTELERRVIEQNKAEAQEQANLVLQKINSGIATQGDVLSISDPTLRSELQKQFVAANKAAAYGPDYEETLKSIKSGAKEIMKESLEGPGSAAAIRLGMTMEKNFAKDYQEGLRRFNGDQQRALNYASDILQRDIDAALLNKDAKARYFSTVGPNNQKIFKNVRSAQALTNRQKAEAEETIRSLIATQNIGALNSPGLLGTESELRQLSTSSRLGQPLLFTPQINQAARLLKISPLEATNLAINAHNKVNQNKIEPLYLDPTLRAISQANPKVTAIFTKYGTSQAARRMAAETFPGALSDPGNMRGGSGNVGAFRAAIIGKESGGNYNAVNPDSGALGIGQVMPENVGPWTRKYLGKSLTPQQFLSNPKAQDAVINGRFRDMLNDQAAAGYKGEEAIRRAAAVWYSGQGSLWNDTRPQYSNGRRYPSIAEYTKAIYDSYRSQL